MGVEVQFIIAMVLFLALLTAGMAVPFAIAVPAVFYLLMQGGLPTLNGLGLIVYGSFTETSVPKLFMAGVIPGVIMTAFFMLYIGVHAALKPGVAPRERGPQSVTEFFRALADVLPFAILITGTLGGIYA